MNIRNGLLVGAVLMLVACFDNSGAPQVKMDNEPSQQQDLIRQEAAVEVQGCSSTWYQQVESQISTGDGAGHGPDLGSGEWRSVVEFKLGIRGDTALAGLNGDDWCRYIDEHYIQVHD